MLVLLKDSFFPLYFFQESNLVNGKLLAQIDDTKTNHFVNAKMRL